MNIRNLLMTITLIAALVLGAGIIASQGNGGSGGESAGEHGSSGEGSGAEGAAGSGGEESGATLALDESYDFVRNGVRLIMAWDANANAFTGTVENVTNATISQVRVEVHLSNGVELGPTPRVDMAPGEVMAVELSAAGTTGFDGWTPHAETGSAGSEGAAEGSEGAEGSGESGGEESGATLTLDESYDFVRNGVRLIMAWDANANAFTGTVENVTNATISQVRVEVHLSNGVELGPTARVDMAPGEMLAVQLSAAGTSGFDGWAPHAETGSGGESSPEGGEHGSGGEGSGAEGSGENGGEESGATLTLDESYDFVRKGVRLIMAWDATANAFVGTVENVTNATISQVRVEVHLSNGVELGPTPRVDMAPGEMLAVELSAAGATGFDGWTPHAETGSGGESSPEGGEHGSGAEGSEGSGEHGGRGEGGSG